MTKKEQQKVIKAMQKYNWEVCMSPELNICRLLDRVKQAMEVEEEEPALKKLPLDKTIIKESLDYIVHRIKNHEDSFPSIHFKDWLPRIDELRKGDKNFKEFLEKFDTNSFYETNKRILDLACNKLARRI